MITSIHHTLQISQNSYATIANLIQNGILHRQSADSYAVSPCIFLTAVNDRHLKIADYIIRTDLYRLPSTESLAIATTSDYREYYELDTISKQLRTAQNEYEAIRILNSAQFTDSGLSPQLVHDSTFSSTWLPMQTQFVFRNGHWFLQLHFNLISQHKIQKNVCQPIALDIGFNPLVSAYSTIDQADFVVDSPVPQFLHALNNNHVLSGAQSLILQRILHAWCRREFDIFTDELIKKASIVYLEDIGYKGLDTSFKTMSRNYSILDWSKVWLPQRLFHSNILYKRIDPNNTSKRCHRCRFIPRNGRTGDMFYCSSCGLYMDSHKNAARNIALYGEKLYINQNYS